MAKLTKAASVPVLRQDDAAYISSNDELAAIDEALPQVERGELASAAQVEAAFERFHK